MGQNKLIVKLGADDFILIAVVIIVVMSCIIVFFLPLEIQDLLKVRHKIFNPVTYLTASFVHGNLEHLGLNLIVFILFAFSLYFINRRVGRQKFFLYSILAMFVVLPLISYTLLFGIGIYQSIEFGFGLSLVDSGLIGVTVPSLVLFFRDKIEEFSSYMFSLSMTLLTFCLVILPFSSSQLFLLIFCALSGFLIGMREFRRIMKFMIESFKQGRRTRLMESSILLYTLFSYAISILGLFPFNIVLQGGLTDIISHYIGLLFGIFPFSIYSIVVHPK